MVEHVHEQFYQTTGIAVSSADDF